MALPPVMIYGDDVTHILTEEGIANLLLCRSAKSGNRRSAASQAIRPSASGATAERREPSRSRRHPPCRGSRHRQARGDARTARGAIDEGSGACIRRSVRAAQALSQLVRLSNGDSLDYRLSRRRGSPVATSAGAGRRRRVRAISKCWSRPRRNSPGPARSNRDRRRGFGAIWQAVLDDFFTRWLGWPTCASRINDCRRDARGRGTAARPGARGVHAARHEPDSWLREATARERIAGFARCGSLRRIPAAAAAHLSARICASSDLPAAFDDGVIVGRGRDCRARLVLVAAQEGGFMGGAVGEVHGAKIVGLLERARSTRVRRRSCCWSNPAGCACTKPMPG